MAFSAREEHVHQKNRPVSSNSYAAMEGRRQAGQIDELLKGLKGKSRRQKIEDAYMAATKTHDYGFPQSISRPPANVSKKRMNETELLERNVSIISVLNFKKADLCH